MTQKTAFDILKSRRSAFLTGPAGSGKTHLLKLFIKYLKDKKLRVAVTATTGLAATHLAGRTIHSWSGIGIARELSASLLSKIAMREALRKEIKETNVLIIDEVSMLHDYCLDMVDTICRHVRQKPEKPFGGLQVVLSGDFFQLPPISSRDEGPAQFVIHAQAWQELQPVICYLDEQYRQQSDDDLSHILNALRRGTLNEAQITKLRERCLPNPGDLIELYCRNLDVDEINEQKLEGIKHPAYHFLAQKFDASKGHKLVDQLIKNSLATEKLTLKKDALVMFIKNNFEAGYINGTLGRVIGFQTAQAYPIVLTHAGRTIKTELASWQIERDQDSLASFRQIPLKLAWAITIHKSQGLTLDGAYIDLSKTFEPGMGYVALSRLKSLGHLYLKGFNEMALSINPLVLEIDRYLQKLSKDYAPRQ